MWAGFAGCIAAIPVLTPVIIALVFGSKAYLVLGGVRMGTIITGNVWGLHSNRMEEHFWRRLRETLSHLGSLRLEPYTITTAKGKAQDLAAMGIMVFGHHFAAIAGDGRGPAGGTPRDGRR